MKLTPLEIRKQEFKKAIRGLDPIEVQTFLEMVAEQYESILEENKSTNRRIIELETKLKDYQENEKNLRETLLNVQEVKKQSEESSRRQADLIIKEAELKGLEILEAARKQTRQIREEVSWLRSQKESFINRLRHILVSQIELLSVMEIDDVIPETAREGLLKSSQQGDNSTPSTSTGTAGEALKKKTDNTGILNDPLSGVHLTAESSEGMAASGDKKTAKTKPAIDSKSTEKKEDNKPADAKNPTQAPEEEQSSDRIVKTYRDEADKKTESSKKKKLLTEDDINDFFKKGIQIDDLIKSINKKEFDK